MKPPGSEALRPGPAKHRGSDSLWSWCSPKHQLANPGVVFGAAHFSFAFLPVSPSSKLFRLLFATVALPPVHPSTFAKAGTIPCCVAVLLVQG